MVSINDIKGSGALFPILYNLYGEDELEISGFFASHYQLKLYHILKAYSNY